MSNENTLDKLKNFTQEVHPVWAVAFVAFVIYLFEAHPIIGTLLLIGGIITVIFKKYGFLILSIIADMIDYGGGAIPIIGDVVDVFVITAQTMRYGKAGLFGMFELVPMADLLPVYTVNAAIQEWRKKE